MVTVFGFDRNGHFDSDFGGVGGFVSHDDYAALEAQVAELEKDAARYRWLRRQCDDKCSRGSIIAASHYGMDWDRNIDEAMSREA